MTNNKKPLNERNSMINSLSGFEEIVRTQRLDKSWILSTILSLEIIYFSKRNNEALEDELLEIMKLTQN